MDSLQTFGTESILCAISYIFNPNLETRLDSMIECAERTGLTNECAKLWAHYGATSALMCASSCPRDINGDITYNGPAPECALDECLDCPTQYNEFFDAMSGRTLKGSGITAETALPCSDFSPVVHDPCVGALATVSPAPTPVVTEDTGSSGGVGTIMTTSRIPQLLTLLALIDMTGVV
jgi:hypothetical protein